IDDDSFFIDDIDYVEASPLDSELVSSEVMEIIIPEIGGIYDDILLTINHNDLQYDCFHFTVEPNSKDFTKDVVENISPMKEPQALNALPTHPTLQLNMKFQPSSESLFSYVMWIFLPFLVYSVLPHYLLSLRTEDIIFNPGICKSTFSRPNISHRYGTAKKFNTHRSHLNKCLMLIHGQNNPLLDVLLFHFHPLDSLKYGGIQSSSFDLKQALRRRHPMLIFLEFFFLLFSIPGFMKILANGFHYLKSSLSPLFNLGITYPNLID
nr:hypothetical protein [Tanacetum cinerariifolium]